MPTRAMAVLTFPGLRVTGMLLTPNARLVRVPVLVDSHTVLRAVPFGCFIYRGLQPAGLGGGGHREPQ